MCGYHLKFSAVNDKEFPSWWAAPYTSQHAMQTGADVDVRVCMIQSPPTMRKLHVAVTVFIPRDMKGNQVVSHIGSQRSMRKMDVSLTCARLWNV